MIERWEMSEEIVDQVCTNFYCRVYRDDFQVYYFTAPNMMLGMLALPEKHRKLAQHPVQINCRKDVDDKLIARDVYYREIPAFVVAFNGENGRVLLRPEKDHHFMPEPWDEVDGKKVEWTPGDIWEDFLSPKIYWFRSEAE